jgi:hypothetical protein
MTYAGARKAEQWHSFRRWHPFLIANVLTVAFVYSFAKIRQKERAGEEEGRLTYLWLIVLVFFFMLYGLYTWGIYPFKQ